MFGRLTWLKLQTRRMGHYADGIARLCQRWNTLYQFAVRGDSKYGGLTWSSTNAVAPGFTHTAVLEIAGSVEDADYAQLVPMGRVAQPREIGIYSSIGMEDLR